MEKVVILCLFILSLNCLSESVNKYLFDDIFILFCFVVEAMMKMNMIKEEKKMMVMENWNMF